MDLSVSYIYGEALALAKKHAVTLIVLFFISMAVSVSASLLLQPAGFLDAYIDALGGNANALERLSKMQSGLSWLSLVQYAVTFALYAVIYNFLISCVRGRKASVGAALSMSFSTVLKFVAVELIYSLALVVGLLLFIVPGVYLGVRLAWAPFYIVEHRDASIGEAFKWSWEASNGRVLELLGLALISCVIMIVVTVAAFIAIALGSLAGSIGISVVALLICAFLLWVVGYISFAQTQAYASLSNMSDSPYKKFE